MLNLCTYGASKILYFCTYLQSENTFYQDNGVELVRIGMTDNLEKEITINRKMLSLPLVLLAGVLDPPDEQGILKKLSSSHYVDDWYIYDGIVKKYIDSLYAEPIRYPILNHTEGEEE